MWAQLSTINYDVMTCLRYFPALEVTEKINSPHRPRFEPGIFRIRSGNFIHCAMAVFIQVKLLRVFKSSCNVFIVSFPGGVNVYEPPLTSCLVSKHNFAPSLSLLLLDWLCFYILSNIFLRVQINLLSLPRFGRPECRWIASVRSWWPKLILW
jgi:hypothetical protein